MLSGENTHENKQKNGTLLTQKAHTKGWKYLHNYPHLVDESYLKISKK